MANAADGRLEISIVDEQGKLTAARAWVDSGDQRLFTPLTASATPYAKDRSVSCDGSFEMSVPSGPAFVHVEKGKDQHHLITRNNIEIERIRSDAAPGASVGATFLFNLNRPVTADRYGPHFPTDAALCRIAREHSPQSVFDSDKPSWAETVVGVALGSLDTIQVCHNHYHRSKTLPGGPAFGCWNIHERYARLHAMPFKK